MTTVNPVSGPSPELVVALMLHRTHGGEAVKLGTPRPTGLPVPAPQFPTMTPAGRRLSSPVPLPAPGGQPDPSPAAWESSDGPLRWTRCPNDGRLHLLQSADVAVAAAEGHAQALCGRPLPAEGLTLSDGCAGALCLACLAGTSPREERPRPEAHRAGGAQPAAGGSPTTRWPIGDQPARR